MTTSNGIVTVNAETSVSINGPVVSGGALVDIDAGTNVSSSADGDITTTGDQANEDSGTVMIHSNVTGNISLDGDVITRGFDNNSGTDGGSVTIMTVDGTIDVTNIDTSGGDVGATTADAGGNAGIINLDANSAVSPRIILNSDLTAPVVTTNVGDHGTADYTTLREFVSLRDLRLATRRTIEDTTLIAVPITDCRDVSNARQPIN